MRLSHLTYIKEFYDDPLQKLTDAAVNITTYEIIGSQSTPCNTIGQISCLTALIASVIFATVHASGIRLQNPFHMSAIMGSSVGLIGCSLLKSIHYDNQAYKKAENYCYEKAKLAQTEAEGLLATIKKAAAERQEDAKGLSTDLDTLEFQQTENNQALASLKEMVLTLLSLLNERTELSASDLQRLTQAMQESPLLQQGHAAAQRAQAKVQDLVKRTEELIALLKSQELPKAKPVKHSAKSDMGLICTNLLPLTQDKAKKAKKIAGDMLEALLQNQSPPNTENLLELKRIIKELTDELQDKDLEIVTKSLKQINDFAANHLPNAVAAAAG